jgi:hypothetical protein
MLTTYAGWTREGALGFGPLAAPSAGGERRERTLGAQATWGTYVGAGRNVLTESRLAASAVRAEATPYRALPGASVLVRSATLDARRDVAGVTLGGGPFVARDEARWTLEGANETIWNARGRRHRFKALAWARADGLRQDAVGNALGSYSFASVDDLLAGRPASFTRTLAQPAREGRVWNAATALAHQWAPSRWFSLLYGARLEASGFLDAPARNPALEQALGVRTGAAPTRLHVSPRLGFSYTYNRDRDNGSGINQNPTGRFYRTTVGVLRGGVGEFRDLLRPGVLADAVAGTGLPGSTATLSCVGAAAPVPDWDAFLADAASIPTRCLDGGAALAERAPSVTLVDPGYDVPRSWRASLDWSSNLGRRWLLRLSGLGSYDLAQPGLVDANFAGTPRLALAGEGGRPVYVSAAAIDPASGAVSPAEGRRSADVGRVGMRTSDLRGYGGQLTAGLSPDVFRCAAARLALHVAQLHAAGHAAAVPRLRRRDVRRPARARVGRGAERRAAPRRAAGRAEHGEARHGHAVRPRAVGAPLHAARAGRRERRRARQRPRLRPRPGDRARRGARRPAARAARRRRAGGAALPRRVARPRGGAQRLPRPVVADAQRAVAPAHPAQVDGARDGERLPAERARRRGPAGARRGRAARLGRHAAPRSRAPRAARLRRPGAGRPALPLRREPALRRHARAQHAHARAVPPRRGLLDRPRDALPGAAAAARPRAGARRPTARGRAARPTRSPRSTCRARRASTARCSPRATRSS